LTEGLKREAAGHGVTLSAPEGQRGVGLKNYPAPSGGRVRMARKPG